MLQCSFSFVAAQLLVKMTSALQKSQCCSATSAAQHFKNCSATSVFACGMLQGWGLEGWGLGLAESRENFVYWSAASDHLGPRLTTSADPYLSTLHACLLTHTHRENEVESSWPALPFLMDEVFFNLQLEFICLQLSFFAYSPLRPLLDALSYCKQKSSNCK